MTLNQYLKKKGVLINKALLELLPDKKDFPSKVHQAMHYSIKGGKRIRPILCLASCKACGGNEKKALKAACGIEMIHTYSLIHDDLPSMDNDDLRRGRLTCHRRFGEAIAILTGDAFLTLAYNVLSKATKNNSLNARIIDVISDATGTRGMIGGQVVDIEKSSYLDLPTLEYINTHKTGALITASCKTGAIIAGASTKQERTMQRFGEYIGLAFQIVDDILDGQGMARLLGKQQAYNRAEELIKKAKDAVACIRYNKDIIYKLADFIVKRKY